MSEKNGVTYRVFVLTFLLSTLFSSLEPVKNERNSNLFRKIDSLLIRLILIVDFYFYSRKILG
jgi:hypothetical protein